jgi:hypothetical protein
MENSLRFDNFQTQKPDFVRVIPNELSSESSSINKKGVRKQIAI